MNKENKVSLKIKKLETGVKVIKEPPFLDYINLFGVLYIPSKELRTFNVNFLDNKIKNISIRKNTNYVYSKFNGISRKNYGLVI